MQQIKYYKIAGGSDVNMKMENKSQMALFILPLFEEHQEDAFKK